MAKSQSGSQTATSNDPLTTPNPAFAEPTDAGDAQEAPKGKVLHYTVSEHTRILSAKDFKSLVPDSELKQTTWGPQNRHRVDVSEWSEQEIQAVLEADSNFKLI